MSQPPNLHYASPSTPVSNRGSLVRLGGALGIAGSILGLIVFFVACAGFGAVYYLSPLPAILGGVGMVLVIVGGVTQKQIGVEDTHILAALFVNLFSLVGGLILLGAWLGWAILPR